VILRGSGGDVVTGRNNRVDEDLVREGVEEDDDDDEDDEAVVVRKSSMPACIVCIGFEVIAVVKEGKVGLEG
jgi:hypothetical protein